MTSNVSSRTSYTDMERKRERGRARQREGEFKGEYVFSTGFGDAQAIETRYRLHQLKISLGISQMLLE
jgi:hypothetical protein